MNRLCAFGALLLLQASLSVHAADTDAVVDEEPKVISVKNKATDADVRLRIQAILEASGWFTNPEATNASGIITLSGTTADPEHKRWAESIAYRTETVIAVINKIVVDQPNPWSLAPLVGASHELIERGLRHMPAFFIGLLVLALAYFIAKRLAATARRVLQHRMESVMLRNLIARLVAIPVLVLGVYLVFSISGLGNLATTLIGGTGLLGLVIGIAFRDITENFLASILLSIQRPFVLGDMIQVLSYTGMVEAMTTRGTVLMTLDGNHVQIPNSSIYKEPITNLTANPNIRQVFSVGIGYDNSIRRVQQLILELLADHPAVLDDPEPLILADELAASTVNLKIYFWVNSTNLSFVKVRSSVIRSVKHTLQREGVSMPDDAREIIFPEGIRIHSAQADEEFKPEPTEPVFDAQEGELATEAEGDLTSEKGQLAQQAKNGVLGETKTNLLER